MPLAVPPPRGSRFGSPPVLSRVYWARPEMVVEVSYEWTPEGLLRYVAYLGEREDKPANRRAPRPVSRRVRLTPLVFINDISDRDAANRPETTHRIPDWEKRIRVHVSRQAESGLDLLLEIQM